MRRKTGWANKRRSEFIDVSWDDNFCQWCDEEFEDCECLRNEEDDPEDDDPPEPENDNEANWAGDTSEKNAY